MRRPIRRTRPQSARRMCWRMEWWVLAVESPALPYDMNSPVGQTVCRASSRFLVLTPRSHSERALFVARPASRSRSSESLVASHRYQCWCAPHFRLAAFRCEGSEVFSNRVGFRNRFWQLAALWSQERHRLNLAWHAVDTHEHAVNIMNSICTLQIGLPTYSLPESSPQRRSTRHEIFPVQIRRPRLPWKRAH